MTLNGLDNGLMEDVVDAYFEWRLESAAVDFAYRKWVNAAATDAHRAHAAYVAALDREERASAGFAESLDSYTRRSPRERRLAEWLHGEA